ncbi:MAG: hypothetical protein KC643_33800 [Nitrospira sp.]|nr:hypothetical protein [Nitrospira sp.]
MYGKIFQSMYDGTLVSVGPWEAMVTFQQLIILADKFGQVDMTPLAISRRTSIPLKIIVKGLKALEQPDPQSRIPVEDGRRIVCLSDTRPWGWRIVNHGHYRQIRSGDERQEYMKIYQRKYRQERKHSVNNISLDNPDKPIKPISGSRNQESGSKIRSNISNAPKRQCVQSLEDWWQEIKENPAYREICCDRELEKMKAWLTTPKARGRKLTKTFALNWLNNVEVPLNLNAHPSSLENLSGKVCWKMIDEGEHLRPCKEPVVGSINGNPHCAKHPVLKEGQS